MNWKEKPIIIRSKEDGTSIEPISIEEVEDAIEVVVDLDELIDPLLQEAYDDGLADGFRDGVDSVGDV